MPLLNQHVKCHHTRSMAKKRLNMLYFSALCDCKRRYLTLTSAQSWKIVLTEGETGKYVTLEKINKYIFLMYKGKKQQSHTEYETNGKLYFDHISH